MNARIKALLQYARALIAEPGTWTKGYQARNAFGEEVEATSPEAVCFCSHGALHRASVDLDASGRAIFAGFTILNSVAWRLTPMHAYRPGDPIGKMLGTISGYNDNHTHEEVLALWDKAIQESAEAVWI